VVAAGVPEVVAQTSTHTARFLREALMRTASSVRGGERAPRDPHSEAVATRSRR
jgi:hypothetical protein